MPRNFSFPKFSFTGLQVKDPRVVARIVVGALLLCNLVAAVFAFRPFGGSAEDLARQQKELTRQLALLQKRVDKTKALADKAERARTEGGKFFDQYFMDRRTTFSTLVGELAKYAQDAGMKQRECSMQLEPTEGSETISQMTVSCAYEGPYNSLTKLVNNLDRSGRFLILDTLAASPQQGGAALNVLIRMDTFVRAKQAGAL